MKLIARILWLFAICATALATTARGQNAPSNTTTIGSTPSLIRQMVGTWDVQQRMWPGADAKAINLPPAVAHRRIIGNVFLEESMESATDAKEDSFTRIACFNYNAVNQQYEYFSLDTRAPQIMTEKSQGTAGKNRTQGELILFGENFVAPRWGDVKNAAFRYRLAIGGIQENQQTVRLYLTPLSGDGGKEFLAFEYVYVRRK